MPTSRSARGRIAFQGLPGAYSDLACRNACPHYETLPCATFEDAFAAVRNGKTELAMIPIENSVAGRVADVHHMLPHSGLHIIGEHFQRVNHHLLAVKGATLKTLKTVQSHVQALDQCRRTTRKLGLKRVVGTDTAGSAAEISAAGDKTRAAIASSLAGQIYGLVSLRRDIEDEEHNTTRFVILSRHAIDPGSKRGPVMTTFFFRVANLPAALYKALGGFATNGVNMTKLESYIAEGSFEAAQFYADVEGHPSDPALARALDELKFFSRELKILGVYPAQAYRRTGHAGKGG
ncbi:MAG: prephenate dehydratase [Alphaproteobacteria bacterium]|nr:prephenate dehydratase [Alphaproteobacteria bacterium]